MFQHRLSFHSRNLQHPIHSTAEISAKTRKEREIFDL